MTNFLWTPSDARISTSLLNSFMQEHGPFDGYDALWEWSVAKPADFWSAVWDFCGADWPCRRRRAVRNKLV
ncbi:hypothetical protein [Marivita sp.]|uniref:hypothetical protein n=1 Tax=Marivita sp. TaxID=2003365 RepID=UPI003F725CDE